MTRLRIGYHSKTGQPLAVHFNLRTGGRLYAVTYYLTTGELFSIDQDGYRDMPNRVKERCKRLALEAFEASQAKPEIPADDLFANANPA